MTIVYRAGDRPRQRPVAVGIQCCIPFCQHTRAAKPDEIVQPNHRWICLEHWRMVPQRLKLSLRRCQQRGDELAYRDRWRACKAAVVRAMGYL